MGKAIILFVIGLICLIKGGDWFVDGASGIARRFAVPELLIGATVVSIGTTLPEVMVSCSAAAIGHGSIAYGNAIGSIICNTSLIAAITCAFNPSKVERSTFKTPVTFFYTAAAIYVFAAYALGEYTRTVGIILLAIFAAYMVIAVKQAAGDDLVHERLAVGAEMHDLIDEDLQEVFSPLWKNIVFLILGAALIAVGAKLLVDNGTIIAVGLGVPESVVALTFVALGTSLPELVTAIVSLVKGHSDLSLGNIIGANMFNLVLVSGLSITINPFSIPAEKQIMGMNSSLLVDIPLAIGTMLILTIPALVKGKVSRTQGVILLLIYVSFCIYQFAG